MNAHAAILALILAFVPDAWLAKVVGVGPTEVLLGDVVLQPLVTPCGEKLVAVLLDENTSSGADGVADRLYVLQTLDRLDRVSARTFRNVSLTFTGDHLEVRAGPTAAPLLWLGVTTKAPRATASAVGYGLSRQEVHGSLWTIASPLTAEQIARIAPNCNFFPLDCPAGGPGAVECGVGCGGDPPNCTVVCGPGFHACCWCSSGFDKGSCCRCKSDLPDGRSVK